MTPLRSVDDYELSVGPVTREIQQAYLDTVRGRSERWSRWLEGVRERGRARRGVTAPRRGRRSDCPRPTSTRAREELVLEVLRSGRLSLSPAIDRFEELFAEAVGAPYAAAVSSGTAGSTCYATSPGYGRATR